MPDHCLRFEVIFLSHALRGSTFARRLCLSACLLASLMPVLATQSKLNPRREGLQLNFRSDVCNTAVSLGIAPSGGVAVAAVANATNVGTKTD